MNYYYKNYCQYCDVDFTAGATRTLEQNYQILYQMNYDETLADQ